MIGTTVGGYRITAQLGEGGMGVVYAAEHSVMGRAAVIKTLRAHLSGDKDIVDRFFNEARAAASIRHPGIVDVYDVGYLDDGAAYIVMDYLEGESLQQRLRRLGALDFGSALSLMRQVLGALGAAHAKGIVHRDLKPDNIFIVRDPELPTGERAKILDFGIAKLQDDPGARGVMTQTGAMMGTPLYMSPEQCRGAGDVDARTDLYAVGCMLFQLLAGRPPFTGDAPGDLYAAHMRDVPPKLSDVTSGLPAGLSDIVDVLLAKRAEDRFATCDAVINAIDEATEGRFATGTVAPAITAVEGPSPPTDPYAATAISGVEVKASTTLGQAAAAVGTVETGMNPARRSSPVVPIVLGVAAIAAAAVVAIVVLRGDDKEVAKPEPEPGPQPVSIDAAVAFVPPVIDGLPPLDFTPVSDGRTTAARKENNRALGMHRKQDYAGAIDVYKAALRADPGYLLARYNLACAYNMSGRRDEGLAVLTQFKDAGCPVCLGRLIRARSDREWASARDDERFIALTRDVVLEQPSIFEMGENVVAALAASDLSTIEGYFDPRARIDARVGGKNRKLNGYGDVRLWLTEHPSSVATGKSTCRSTCCKFEPVDGAEVYLEQFCTTVDSGSVRLIDRIDLAGPGAKLPTF